MHREHTTVMVLFTVSVTVTMAAHTPELWASACPAGAALDVAGRTVTVSVTGIQSVIVVVGSAELVAWASLFAIPDPAPATGAEGAALARGVEA